MRQFQVQSLAVLTCVLGACALHLANKPKQDGQLEQRFPSRPTRNDAACLTAVAESDLPVVLYMTKTGGCQFSGCWFNSFVSEILGDLSDDQLIFCETRDPHTIAPQVLALAGYAKVAFLFEREHISLHHDMWTIKGKSVRQPDMFIHLDHGDGDHDRAEEWYVRLLPEDGLVLRQFNYPQVPYHDKPPVHFLPAGFDRRNPFPADVDSCTLAQNAQAARNGTSRTYVWSFLNKDMSTETLAGQTYMLEGLTSSVDYRTLPTTKRKIAAGSKSPGDAGLWADSLRNSSQAAVDEAFHSAKHLIDLTSSQDWTNIYSVLADTTFWPMGQVSKYVSIETPLLYGAVLAGAIPVLVMDPDPLKSSFNHTDPPFLFESTWNDAKRRMVDLASTEGGIDDAQDRVVQWWCDWMDSIRKEAASFLTASFTTA